MSLLRKTYFVTHLEMSLEWKSDAVKPKDCSATLILKAKTNLIGYHHVVVQSHKYWSTGECAVALYILYIGSKAYGTKNIDWMHFYSCTWICKLCWLFPCASTRNHYKVVAERRLGYTHCGQVKIEVPWSRRDKLCWVFCWSTLKWRQHFEDTKDGSMVIQQQELPCNHVCVLNEAEMNCVLPGTIHSVPLFQTMWRLLETD